VELPEGYAETYANDFPVDCIDDVGTVRWFGPPWPHPNAPAPICDPRAHVTLPDGVRCQHCWESLSDTDQGVGIPAATSGEYVWYGLTCFMKTLGL
jgi:hypothetical protein